MLFFHILGTSTKGAYKDVNDGIYVYLNIYATLVHVRLIVVFGYGSHKQKA